MIKHKGAFGIIDVSTPVVHHVDDDPQGKPLVIDLPLPPSVNRTSGLRLGNEHPKVKQWRRHADAHLIYTRQSKHLRAIEGPVCLDIWWDTQVLGDVDNRIKHLLDYLQRLRIVTDDSQCRRLVAEFGIAPDGCRVRVQPWHWQPD